MQSDKVFTVLADYAIEYTKAKYPDIRTGYMVDNISDEDVERILWYVLQTYEDIAEDDKLKKQIVEYAKRGNIRKVKCNEFLKEYYASVIKDEGAERIPMANLSEKESLNTLTYIIANYSKVWDDDELLQGIALFSRIAPVNPERSGNTNEKDC